MNASTLRELPPSSHVTSTRSVRNLMGWVLIALLPGIAMRIRVLGVQELWLIATALAFALPIEALLLHLRRQPSRIFLFDGSTAITAVLLALCLPAETSWWIVVFGIGAALLLGKHVYGGLGRNPFNPAMLGVALALVCFPPTLAATSSSVAALHRDHAVVLIAAADALGGLMLLWLRIVRWQLPLAIFAAAAVAAGAFWQGDGAASMQVFFAGNLVLAAFFIASDPVSGCVTRRGRWAFGAGIGLLFVLLGRYAGATVGLAFAVLLMNGAAPWIDRTLQPDHRVVQPHG